MNYLPIIGLEIHVQLKTKTKMFCSCPTHDSATTPNSHICPICLGHPGTLPVPNKQAIAFGILTGLALNCTIADRSKFDRKNYFYPDLPKSYQISQFDLPVAENGFLEIDVPEESDTPIKIGITRAHLEEDAAKNNHDKSGKTYVDFNRGGTPLIEIVSEPDFRSAKQAKIFLQELRLIARYLGISDADMEKGHMRCDANISLRQIDDEGNVVGQLLNPKTEMKNLNSFKHVERAIEYEIRRQTKAWKDGNPPMTSTTRGWDDAKGKSIEQRSKEEAADYRYFPEPDIPAMLLKDTAEEMRMQLPELPRAKRVRFIEEFKLKPSDAKQICDDPFLANFTEAAFSETESWVRSFDDLDENDPEVQKKMSKLYAGWMLSKLQGILLEKGISVKEMKISPENFAEFLSLLARRQLNNTNGLKVLETMLETGDDPTHIMENQQLGQMDDEGALAEIIDRVISANPQEVTRYKAGEKKLIKFFIGMAMKESEGSADPGLSANIFKVKLEGETD